VEVEDDGPGIPTDKLDRIFDRHYQVEGGAKPEEGSGIGLSIVREILASHGCGIQARSRPGHGTTFFFDLPLSTEAPGPRPQPPGGDRLPEADEGPAPSDESDRPSDKRPRFRIIRRYNSNG